MRDEDSPFLLFGSDRNPVDESFFEETLLRGELGFLVTTGKGQPLNHPRPYIYDPAGKVIYFYAKRNEGLVEVIAENDRACFAVSLSRQPAETERQITCEQVTVYGYLAALSDPEEKRRALALLEEKYFPILSPSPYTEGDLARIAIFSITNEAWSGTRSLYPDDEPGTGTFRSGELG